MKDRFERVSVVPIKVKELAEGKIGQSMSLGDYVMTNIEYQGLDLRDKDIVVITSKIISVFEGRVVRLKEVKPSLSSKIIGAIFGKDARKVDLIRREGTVAAVIPFKKIAKTPALWERLLRFSANPQGSKNVIEEFTSVFMVNKYDTFLDDAGLDFSNMPDGCVACLPEYPFQSAKEVRRQIKDRLGINVAVIVTDTVSVPGKLGSLDTPLGYAGIEPITRKHGHDDLYNNPKSGGMDLIVDALAAIAGLTMGQTNEASPICLIRGYDYEPPLEECEVSGRFYPTGLLFKSTVLTVLSTLGYYLVAALTWPFTFIGNYKRKKKS